MMSPSGHQLRSAGAQKAIHVETVSLQPASGHIALMVGEQWLVCRIEHCSFEVLMSVRKRRITRMAKDSKLMAD